MVVKKTYKYILIKNNNENDISYNVRKSFLEILKPKDQKEFNLYNMYSNIFVNMIYLKCKYSEKTEKFIKNFLKKNKKILTKLTKLSIQNKKNINKLF
jgi:hypothetical protein